MAGQQRTNRREITAGFDPSGSIFLPPSAKDAEWYLENMKLALTLRRGQFSDPELTVSDQVRLMAEIDQVRDVYVGRLAVETAGTS